MDANNSAQSRDVMSQHLIEQIQEGMRVFDSTGKEVGKVEDVRMGDPNAVTDTDGESGMVTPAPVDVARRVTILEGTEDIGPMVPEPERSNLLRIGYLRVQSGGILGIGTKARYVRTDMIADVAGDRVILAVPMDDLPGEHGDDRPLAA